MRRMWCGVVVVAVGATLVLGAPPTGAVSHESRAARFVGRVGVALVADAEGRTTIVAVQAVTTDLLLIVLRACDRRRCISESGLRHGRIEERGRGTWHLRLATSSHGTIRLTGSAGRATFVSRGCSLDVGPLRASVATEGVDVATVSWRGTIGGRAVRSPAGPRCSVVHTAGVTELTFHSM